MKSLKPWQDSKGRFKKGELGAMTGKKHKPDSIEKMRQAKLKNPTRYWLGKKRKIAKIVRQRKDGYRYIAFSLIEPHLHNFLKKWWPRPVPEHHYVYVKRYLSPIPEGFHIHHINGIKNDNRIKNLAIMIPSEHSKLHNPK